MAIGVIQNIVKNRDAIRKIMAMDRNGKMDQMLENAVRSGSVKQTGEGISFNGSMNYSNNNNQTVINEQVIKNSKMPKKIIESFQQNPGASVEMQMPTSVLDTLGLEKIEDLRRENTNESTSQVAIGGGGQMIDYSLIRTIINEAVQENVKKYMSALSKKILSEGVSINGDSNNVQAVKLGKSFSFITENGDVYEATMKYKTNLNNKQNKKATK